MKTQLKLFILVLLVLCPVFLYGQDHPELDAATSFAIYKNGQNIFVEYTPFRQIMGNPDAETIDYDGMDLEYGASKFSFITGFYQLNQSHLYFVELKDASYRVNINGVDIRVGDLADELAEHFPKSWAVKQSDPNPETRGYLSIEVSEVEFIDILISSNGVIQSVIYWMRLT
ncbi:MAG: hypothetical protein JJU41_00035 [Bacteroidetes bacterium]|nr:hypothetical protein [Bacteroidota bacterium]